MLYIIVALKAEAQAFVDKYKLNKSKLGNFTLFSNANMMLIVSNIGVANARRATQTFIDQFDITDDDIYLNTGICGAQKRYEIGQLLEIGSVVYNDISYDFKADKKKIVCLDAEANESFHEIVDMESFGFYDAVIHSPAIKHFHILKVVSDHFEPHKVTKEFTKELLFNVINDISYLVHPKESK